MQKSVTARKGFTLVELLVVIAIIGILTSIITASLTGAKAAARDAKRISDLKALQISLALYYNDNNHYPCRIDVAGAVSQCLPNFFGTYITSLPVDPSTGTAYTYNALNLASGSTNCNSNAPLNYHIGATMETNNNLGQDTDWASGSQSLYNSGGCTGSAAKFDGLASSCSGTTANTTAGPSGTENCFDVSPDF